jgi:hypothetical protein
MNTPAPVINNVANNSAYVDPSLLTTPAAQLPTCPGPGNALPLPFALGTIYQFVNVGDSIGTHTHPDGTGHYSVVWTGSVEYTTYNTDGSIASQAVYNAPAVFAVPTGVAHSFEGLTAGSLLINQLYAIFNPATISANVQALNAQLTQLQSMLTAVLNLTV